MEDRKTLLSVSDLEVKFRVRGRILTAIRGISLDIYENESIAIVGESGSGKSVFTKTFAGMLDSNGFISNGSILFNDPELADTRVVNHPAALGKLAQRLDRDSALEHGAETFNAMKALEEEKARRTMLSPEEEQALDDRLSALVFKRTEEFNQKQTFDPSREKEAIRASARRIEEMDGQIKALKRQKQQRVAELKRIAAGDTGYNSAYNAKMAELKARYAREIAQPAGPEAKARNQVLAKEILLSTGRYGAVKRSRMQAKLLDALKSAMQKGVDLTDDEALNRVFAPVTFRVRYLDETPEQLHGTCAINLADIHEQKDWSMVRGTRIATVFQDPMTSLNPIITIGKQITSIILKHQDCSEVEARARALELMHKVGIPNAEHRFDDYPFEYSGGMRQRIVIAIALSCQPKILICDEPTTALDVTIQAQILKLLKDLQREFGYTIVFITHDLGVVANVADRVAVMYAGQIVEVGKVEEVFYDPRHPYTWALLSSLPQLAQKNTQLYSITGTPPSLYNKIVGDPFAPRNPYCMKIDTLLEPPMFRVTDTHFAKTWLEDPRAPKVQKPEIIENIHQKLIDAFNI